MGVVTNSILAWLDRGLVNKISFSMAEKGHGKIVSVSMAGKGVVKKSISAWLEMGVVNQVSLCMAGKGHDKKSQF
jgi:hypothetical protein